MARRAECGAEPGGGERARGCRSRTELAVEFSVRDFGQGIASEHLDADLRAVLPGGQGAVAGVGRDRAGAGDCAAYGGAQGGTIRAESELNAGSNFLVTLPKASRRLVTGREVARVYSAFHRDVTFP